jgi:hypothetical protein
VVVVVLVMAVVVLVMAVVVLGASLLTEFVLHETFPASHSLIHWLVNVALLRMTSACPSAGLKQGRRYRYLSEVGTDTEWAHAYSIIHFWIACAG